MKKLLLPRFAGLFRGSMFLSLAAIFFFASSVRGDNHGRAGGIRPGDKLDIEVFDHPNLSREVRVLDDGRIRLPLIGWVQAGGKSVANFSEELSEAYIGVEIENAFVTVSIIEYGPRTVYVTGEVLEGGAALEITPPAELTVAQAVSSTGGFTDNADLRNVIVRRRNAEGEVEELEVDVLDLITGSKGAADPALEPGDTVIIPRSRPVYVSGEINNPGTYYIGTSSALRCSEIIGRAGGLTEAADRSRVLISRPAFRSEKETRLIEVNMENVFAGGIAEDVRIKPGDMVMVSRRNKIFVFGEVENPGAIDPEPDVPLTAFQALTMSGGFTAYASRNDVLLVRGDESRTIDLRTPYREGEESTDPELRPGDILFVRSSIW